MNVIDIEEEK